MGRQCTSRTIKHLGGSKYDGHCFGVAAWRMPTTKQQEQDFDVLRVGRSRFMRFTTSTEKVKGKDAWISY